MFSTDKNGNLVVTSDLTQEDVAAFDKYVKELYKRAYDEGFAAGAKSNEEVS